MEMRALGKSPFKVSAIGLGLMSMSGIYGNANDEESIRVIHYALDANFYEVHRDIVQKAGPALPREGWSKPYSPQMKYSWHVAYAALKASGEPILEYTNPVTGGSIMPTIGARLELVSRKSKNKRNTGNSIYQVAVGQGRSVIGGEVFEWQEKDIFCVPSWTEYQHEAKEEAVLFSFNDFPAMKALALYREQDCG